MVPTFLILLLFSLVTSRIVPAPPRTALTFPVWAKRDAALKIQTLGDETFLLFYFGGSRASCGAREMSLPESASKSTCDRRPSR